MHNERCTSGSEGGLEKPTGRKIGRALRSDPTVNPLKRNARHDPDKTMTMISSPFRTALLLTALLFLGACACPARAGEMPTAGPEAEASRVIEEVLRKAGGEGEDSLGEWSRGVIDRALDRAGETARQTVPGSESGAGPGQAGQTAPLPAEHHVRALTTRQPSTAEVLIFTSLSVATASWRQWAHDAARTGAPLVLRGVGAGGLRQTARAIRARLGGREPGTRTGSGAGIAIDPRLFRLFGIERVPAVVVVPGGVPACETRGCSGDLAPPHDLIAGNIGLVAALEAVVAEGDAGREAARWHLERLMGGNGR